MRLRRNIFSERPRLLRLQERGMLMNELNTAIAVFALFVFSSVAPLVMEQAAVRRETARAVAMSIVDGEAELLAAGGWRKFERGTYDYEVTQVAAKTLPPGRFVLQITESAVHLEWREIKPGGREITRAAREFKR